MPNLKREQVFSTRTGICGLTGFGFSFKYQILMFFLSLSSGYGGGFNERENVEYIEREESDGEYDEVSSA